MTLKREKETSYSSRNVGYTQKLALPLNLFHVLQNKFVSCITEGGIPDGTVVKNPPANARDVGPIPGLGRSSRVEMATHSTTVAWKIPWTNEPGQLSPRSAQSRTQPSTNAHVSKIHVVLV